MFKCSRWIALAVGLVMVLGSQQVSAKGQEHAGRNGQLSPQEMAMAKAAWAYFEVATQKETGLADSVLTYPSTTMWDTASYIAGMVAAHELGLIDRYAFDARLRQVLATLQKLELFRGELPNKVYDTRTGAKVDYTNKPGEVGFSSNDLGRLLIWLKILKDRYPYHANSIDNVVLRWRFCNVVQPDGTLRGAAIAADGKTNYFQEGRLGYEEYAAKGFALWGFATRAADSPDPLAWTEIMGERIPYDGRDPRITKTMNYVVTEPFILDGLELNFDLPGDTMTSTQVASDGWRAEFATRIVVAQQRRWEYMGIMTARSEHNVEGPPYFVYDTLFANGYAWNTLDPKDNYTPERAAIATKAAIGIWALWPSVYSDRLFDAVSNLYVPDKGFYEGLYENGRGVIPLQTANNNGIILTSLLYKATGPLLTYANTDTQMWEKADSNDYFCRPSVRTPLVCKVRQPIAAKEFTYCKPVAGASASAVAKLAGQEAIGVTNCALPQPGPKKIAQPQSCNCEPTATAANCPCLPAPLTR